MSTARNTPAQRNTLKKYYDVVAQHSSACDRQDFDHLLLVELLVRCDWKLLDQCIERALVRADELKPNQRYLP